MEEEIIKIAIACGFDPDQIGTGFRVGKAVIVFPKDMEAMEQFEKVIGGEWWSEFHAWALFVDSAYVKRASPHRQPSGPPRRKVL
jgi:hypothetical protein